MAKEEKDLDEMTGPELVALYNANILKVGGVGAVTVKRFATKAEALRRTRRLLAQVEAQKVHPDYKPVHPKQQVRAAQAARSWKDKTVRAARIARHPVSVNGVEYASVKRAFEALELPMGSHIVFRVALVKSGLSTRTFTAPDGRAYEFKLTETK